MIVSVKVATTLESTLVEGGGWVKAIMIGSLALRGKTGELGGIKISDDQEKYIWHLHLAFASDSSSSRRINAPRF